MSRIKDRYAYGWTDLRGAYDAKLDGYFSEMVYEVRYGFTPDGYQVVKRSFVRQEVLASGLTKEAAEGYLKLLKEE